MSHAPLCFQVAKAIRRLDQDAQWVPASWVQWDRVVSRNSSMCRGTFKGKEKRVYSNNSFITTAKDHVLLTSSRCFCQIYILLCCAVRVRDFLLQNSLASTLIPQQIVLVSSQCLLCVTHLVKARTSQCSCYWKKWFYSVTFDAIMPYACFRSPLS